VTARAPARDAAAEVAFLTRALKAPTLRESVSRLAERARAENWTHEEFLIACLQREVAARDAHGGEGRIRAARFPARKSLEEFDYDHARGLKREVIAHLGTLDFVTARDNVVFLGPPGTGKTHLATGIAIRACQAGHRVLFATAAEWVARLADAHQAGTLQAELARLGRYPVLVIDEVGYIPFEPEAANLFFQLVSARYERASLIVTSNKPFGKAHLFPRTCARRRLRCCRFARRSECADAAWLAREMRHEPSCGSSLAGRSDRFTGVQPTLRHRPGVRSRQHHRVGSALESLRCPAGTLRCSLAGVHLPGCRMACWNLA
jgi:DNA replication protein DnaC